jgi:hypothetical protein
MDSLEKVVYETPAVQVVELAAENAICNGSGQEQKGRGNGFSGWY